ncbi:MAG: DinB family protein [Nocardioides sp.]
MRGDHRLEGFEADEAETQLRLLDYLFASMGRKLEGLSEEQVRVRHVPSGTTLLWLAKHVAAAESLWLEHFFTGELSREELPDEDELDDETVATVVALMARTARRTREIVASHPDLDQLSVADVPRHGHVSLRWILAHLVEEVARHAGHADILRELTDGAVGR